MKIVIISCSRRIAERFCTLWMRAKVMKFFFALSLSSAEGIVLTQ